MEFGQKGSFLKTQKNGSLKFNRLIIRYKSIHRHIASFRMLGFFDRMLGFLD